MRDVIRELQEMTSLDCPATASQSACPECHALRKQMEGFRAAIQERDAVIKSLLETGVLSGPDAGREGA